MDELLARIRVALRHAARSGAGTDSVFRSGDLSVDLERREVRTAGKRVHLTPTEYALLGALIADAGRVLTDRALLQRVWGPEYGSEDHYLHVYMAPPAQEAGARSGESPLPAHRAGRRVPPARAGDRSSQRLKGRGQD